MEFLSTFLVDINYDDDDDDDDDDGGGDDDDDVDIPRDIFSRQLNTRPLFQHLVLYLFLDDDSNNNNNK